MFSTAPKTLKSHFAMSVFGTGPKWRSGQRSGAVRVWPGGMRAGSTPSGTRLFLKKEATQGEYRSAGILAPRPGKVTVWARGAAGSALESHSRGQGFESPRVHQFLSQRLHSARTSGAPVSEPEPGGLGNGLAFVSRLPSRADIHRPAPSPHPCLSEGHGLDCISPVSVFLDRLTPRRRGVGDPDPQPPDAFRRGARRTGAGRHHTGHGLGRGVADDAGQPQWQAPAPPGAHPQRDRLAHLQHRTLQPGSIRHPGRDQGRSVLLRRDQPFPRRGNIGLERWRNGGETGLGSNSVRPLHDSELRSKLFWLKTCSNSRVTSAWPASDMSPPLSNYFAEFILSRVAEHRARLIGNRWTLVGAILYLLEWVAIAGFNPGNTPTSFLKPDAVVTMYASHAGGVAAAASWFSVVLLGRILFTVGIRDSLKRSGADTLLADFAVG